MSAKQSTGSETVRSKAIKLVEATVMSNYGSGDQVEMEQKQEVVLVLKLELELELLHSLVDLITSRQYK